MVIDSNTRVNFIYNSHTPSGLVKIASKVARDIELVTDGEASVTENKGDGINVYFGIIGECELPGDIDASVLTGKREVYLFKPVSEENALVIAGSDKRGVIYGLFHISDLLGVSPLVNWSNVIPAKKSIELTSQDTFLSKEPSVRYRGFFINDEWPCFGNWCMSHFGGVNAKMYEGVFELLLRMKGNYLWPAMWASCFAEDGPGLESAVLADELGVVMGLSHHEPCLRHGEEYSHVRGKDSIYGDAWDFRANPDGITRFWRDGLKRNGHLENVITVGMRGERDSMILGENATLKDNIDLLRDVLKTQNQLIREEVNENLDEVPRMLALYKEVEPYYYGDENTEGLKNSSDLDGVTLLLCEDNHGYLRSLPDEEMRHHKGGFGMYYHFDYHGEPVSYEWINSTYLPEVWEQMTTAYEHGVRDLWIVNVGDLGLNELPLTYFMSLAYDYDKWGIEHPNTTPDYTEDMLRLQFGAAFDEADIIKLRELYIRYTRLIHNRRPEHMSENVYHPQNFYEGTFILKEATELYDICETLLDKCPEEYKDSFIELIAYNVMAGTNLVMLWIYRGLNHYYASVGAIAANMFGDLVRQALGRDEKLKTMFREAADGKWAGFELAEHIGFKNWNSEECANPVIETVIPKIQTELIVGLMGETAATSGQEWTGKILNVTEYTEIDEKNAFAKVYVSPMCETEVPFEVTTGSDKLSVNCGRNTVSKEVPVTTIDFTIEKEAWLSGEIPEAVVSYEKGRVRIVFNPPSSDRYVCDADSFAKSVDTEDGRVLILKDIGRRESGVKFLPVTEDMPASEKGPYLDYEFDIADGGEFEIIFQMLPTSAYTFGADTRIAYAVNPDGTGSDIRFIEVTHDTYKDKERNNWWMGVLSHVRYVKAKVSLKKGRNTVRYYGASRENVLERILLLREGYELPESYLGPRG